MSVRTFLPMITLGLVVAAVIVLDRAPFRERSEGTTAIFNGRDLTGWHVSAQSPNSDGSDHRSGGRWLVRNGAVWGVQDEPGNGGLLVSNRQYGDVEVVLEMRNDFGPDGGLYLRSTDAGRAYEVTIDYREDGSLMGVDGARLPGVPRVRPFTFGATPLEVEAAEGTGEPPIAVEDWRYLWRHGEWNRLRARIRGNPPTITTWINGTRLLRWTDSERRLPDSGHVALELGGEGDYTNQFVRYRRIRVRHPEQGTAPVDSAVAGR